MEYRHRQVGWVMILVLGAIAALLVRVAVAVGGPYWPVQLFIAALYLGLVVLFSSMTVVVGAEGIDLRLGPGSIRQRVPFDEIESVAPHHLPWWAIGFGIRMSLDGKRKLWRVSGSDTVNLQLSGGRRLLIGTDEPEALSRVIQFALNGTRRA